MEKPFYDTRFRQWCINYTTKEGGYGGVWADTEEECIELYKNARAAAGEKINQKKQRQ